MLQPTVIFDDSGRIDAAAYEARFTALPNKQLLTLAVVPPDAWMVQSVYAIYDLDNIRLENVRCMIFYFCSPFDILHDSIILTIHVLLRSICIIIYHNITMNTASRVMQYAIKVKSDFLKLAYYIK